MKGKPKYLSGNTPIRIKVAYGIQCTYLLVFHKHHIFGFYIYISRVNVNQHFSIDITSVSHVKFQIFKTNLLL